MATARPPISFCEPEECSVCETLSPWIVDGLCPDCRSCLSADGTEYTEDDRGDRLLEQQDDDAHAGSAL